MNTPEKLYIATKYSLLNNGKRLRPVLVYAVGNLFNNDLHTLNAVAASVELMHCYSLVHDDLPAMDDDDLRRGKPSCHKAFDEATAILVGDGLQTLAFEILINPKINPFNDAIRCKMLHKLAQAAGLNGMVRGQSLDMNSEHKIISLNNLEEIHRYKTGALINCCLELALLANTDNHDNKLLKQELLNYGTHLGLIFQIKDDILDLEQSTDILGKPSKSDQKSQKATFVSILGLAGAKKQLEKHYNLVISAVENLSQQAIFSEQKIALLKQCADYFKYRKF